MSDPEKLTDQQIQEILEEIPKPIQKLFERQQREINQLQQKIDKKQETIEELQQKTEQLKKEIEQSRETRAKSIQDIWKELDKLQENQQNTQTKNTDINGDIPQQYLTKPIISKIQENQDKQLKRPEQMAIVIFKYFLDWSKGRKENQKYIEISDLPKFLKTHFQKDIHYRQAKRGAEKLAEFTDGIIELRDKRRVGDRTINKHLHCGDLREFKELTKIVNEVSY